VQHAGEEYRKAYHLARRQAQAGRTALGACQAALTGEKKSALSERERSLMLGILAKLIQGCEMTLRRRLSEQLVKSPPVPKGLVGLLRRDDLALTRKTLTASNLLQDQALVQIIRRRSQQHLLAGSLQRMAGNLPNPSQGPVPDGDLMAELLAHKDKPIREAALSYLAEQSRRVDAYQDPLLRRRELAPATAQRFGYLVAAALRDHILDHFPVNPAQLDFALARISREMASKAHDGLALSGGPAAGHLAGVLADRSGLRPAHLLQALRCGQIPLFEAIFSEISTLPRARIQHLLYDGLGEGLAILARAMDLPKTDFATLYVLSRRGRGPSEGGEAGDVTGMLGIFERSNPRSAKQLVEIWRQAPDYVAALESLSAFDD
jgi:uncharacterized protein (DUF2336 family)